MSIASQLQAIRSIVKADTDPHKRPFTRPSILFDAKEAADIDLDTLFNLALSGIINMLHGFNIKLHFMLTICAKSGPFFCSQITIGFAVSI